jgi:hypothetical protein
VPEIPSAAERLGLPNSRDVDVHDSTIFTTTPTTDNNNNNSSDGSSSSSPMPRRSRRVEQFVRKLQSRKINVKSPKWLPEGGFLFVG